MRPPLFIPKCLALAAKASNDPTWVGEVVIALVNGAAGKRLDHGQQTVLAMCREELEEREAKRKAWAERKRRSRAKGGSR